jgi:hypothetical protein
LAGGWSLFFFSAYFFLCFSSLFLFSSSVSRGAVVDRKDGGSWRLLNGEWLGSSLWWRAVFAAVFPVCAEGQAFFFFTGVAARGKRW